MVKKTIITAMMALGASAALTAAEPTDSMDGEQIITVLKGSGLGIQ